MMRAGTEFTECTVMFGSRVADISGPAVVRVFPMELVHEMITGHFGNYRGRCNGLTALIPFNKCKLWAAGAWNMTVAINQERLWQTVQQVNCTLHSKQGCFNNIEFRNLFGVA